jgi:EAL domain-containing protein (putative c-di-GMP-specific phosphodiesterase class I)
VLHQACAQWLRWQAQDPVAAPASVSVNLSRVQMAVGSHLVTVVHQAIEAGGMPPEALQLEITERELMRDPGAARELMLALASLGVRLILDDFGTGQSSLARLRDHVFHSVKIDRSFVTGLSLDHHMLAVAHATVNVIENLGMASIAEGIETPAELATLQALGCRFGQGRLFSGPLPPDRLLSLMARKVRSPSAVSSTAATPAP